MEINHRKEDPVELIKQAEAVIKEIRNYSAYRELKQAESKPGCIVSMIFERIAENELSEKILKLGSIIAKLQEFKPREIDDQYLHRYRNVLYEFQKLNQVKL